MPSLLLEYHTGLRKCVPIFALLNWSINQTPKTVDTVDWPMLHTTHNRVQKRYANWQLPAYKNILLLQCGLHVMFPNLRLVSYSACSGIYNRSC